MSGGDALRALEGLAGGLRQLLEQVDERGNVGPRAKSSPMDAALRATWSRCRELFAAYRSGEEEAAALDPAARETLTRALRDVARLNAVARAAVSRAQSRVAAELRSVPEARAKLRTVRSRVRRAPGPTGQSCDVRG